jgi:ABC-type transport system involved in multi-copper enzyme maturation permease subunit
MIVTLALKELKHLFATPLAWFTLLGVQLILAWLFLGQIDAWLALEAQLAELANPPGITEIIVMPLFGSAAILLMLATPLLGMNLIAGERRERTFALLLSAPLPMRHIVLGKFLGLAAFLALLALLPAAMACSLYLGGALDAGLLAANLLGLLLLMLFFAAAALFLSSLTAHPALAAIATQGIFLALWLVSLPAREPDSLLHAFSPLKHFETFNRGLAGGGGALALAGCAALLLALTACRLESGLRGWSRGRKLFAVAAIAGLALLPPYAQWHPLSRDLTHNGRHSLDPASLDVLRQLNGPLAVTAWASRQDAELGDIRKIIHDFFVPWRNAKPDLSLVFIDPAAEPQRARETGILSNVELVIAYGGRSEHLTELNEQALANALLRLARNRPVQLGFLDGHGERALHGGAAHDLGSFGRQLKQRGVQARPVDLSDAAGIPRQIDALLVTTPQNALLPGEIERVQDWLTRGGNLLWLLEPGTLNGLQPLAETLGLTLAPGVVIGAETRGRYASPAVAHVSAWGRHPVTERFALTSVFPDARQLAFNEDSGWHVTPLAESSAQSWVETGDAATPAFDPQRDVSGPLILAAALERTVEDRRQRVAVIGGAAFLSNAWLGLGGNLDFGVSLVNWLAGDDTLVALSPRSTRDARLDLSRNAANAIGAAFLVLLPLAFLGAGVRVWWRRRHLH